MLLPLLVSASTKSFVTRHGPTVRLKAGRWRLEVSNSKVKVAIVDVKTKEKLTSNLFDLLNSTEIAAQVIEPGGIDTVTVFARRIGEAKSTIS